MSFAFATDNAIEEFKENLNKLNTRQSPNTNQSLCECCDTHTSSSTIPTCEQLAYDFCTKLWSAPNKGNLDLGNHQGFALGQSKSGLSQADVQYYQALFDGYSRLPADIRKMVTPEVEALQIHFKKENSSKQWHNKLNTISDSFSEKLKQVSIDRFAKQNPHLNNKKLSDLNSKDLQRYYEIRSDVHDDLAKAQFQNHPKWQKVERLFAQAQNDIQQVIDKLQIPTETKAMLKKKIAKISLQLPSSDPRKGFISGCISSSKNATYFTHNDTVVICAGFFLGIQNEDALYSILAHELGHSIEGRNILATDFFQSPEFQTLIQLCEKPNTLDCQKWKDFTSHYKAQIRPLPRQSPWSKIEQCWKAGENLIPYSHTHVETLAKGQNIYQLSNSANLSIFSTLADHNSKFFLDPAGLLQDLSKDSLLCTKENTLPFIFTQELKCSNFASASAQNKKELFAKALQMAQRLDFESLKSLFDQTGENAESLWEIQMAIPLNERFADWISQKALAKRIQDEPSLDKRRQSVLAAAASNFCTGLDDAALLQDLREIENKHSLKPYPSERQRRLSFFTKENRQIIQCKETPAVLEATKCDM